MPLLLTEMVGSTPPVPPQCRLLPSLSSFFPVIFFLGGSRWGWGEIGENTKLWWQGKQAGSGEAEQSRCAWGGALAADGARHAEEVLPGARPEGGLVLSPQKETSGFIMEASGKFGLLYRKCKKYFFSCYFQRSLW